MLKKSTAILLCILLALSSVGWAESAAGDTEIVDRTVELFSLLAAVPRPSGHEEKISAYLAEWAEAQGMSPVRDGLGNIMFDVPATAGMEDKPLCHSSGV